MNILLFLLLLSGAGIALPAEIAFLQGCWTGTGDDRLPFEKSCSSSSGALLLGHVLLTRASGVENGESMVQEYRRLPRARAASPPAN